MKKIINIILSYIGHFLIYFCCHINSPFFCAYLIKISILRDKLFQKKIKSKKIIIVLDRAIGHRDIEIIRDSSKNTPQFMFLRRSITKIILLYFSYQKKIFLNYLDPPIYEKDYFTQSKDDRNKHEIFWGEVIYNLKKLFKDKSINFVTFNYTYFAEIGLYAGCKKNNVPVKLWHKEGIKTDVEADIEAKTWGVKFKHVFKYFSKISTYNNLVKKMFIQIDKSNKKKIIVIGSPRVNDYINKKKYVRKIKTLLFLSFDNRRGIPNYKKNKNLNWSFSHKKVIKILNELSHNQNIKIIIKRKSNFKDEIHNQITKNIEIYSHGTAKDFVNRADIIIGQNSASTIEALVNGKYVMVPFFERDLKMKKFLYNFHKDIIFTSEKKMKENIIMLLNKKIQFPLNNKKHENTIKYYLGNTKKVSEKYISFLNN